TALSRKGLRDSHIFLSDSNGIDGCHGGELVPANAHGLWAGWFVVAIPSSEASDDPGEPSERAELVRVFLPRRVAFECGSNDVCGGDDVLVGDIGRRPRASVTRIDQLDDARGRYQGDGGEFEQPVGLRDLRLLQGQP